MRKLYNLLARDLKDEDLRVMAMASFAIVAIPVPLLVKVFVEHGICGLAFVSPIEIGAMLGARKIMQFAYQAYHAGSTLNPADARSPKLHRL